MKTSWISYKNHTCFKLLRELKSHTQQNDLNKINFRKMILARKDPPKAAIIPKVLAEEKSSIDRDKEKPMNF